MRFRLASSLENCSMESLFLIDKNELKFRKGDKLISAGDIIDGIFCWSVL